jgi:Ca-activated chloride channel family protein
MSFDNPRLLGFLFLLIPFALVMIIHYRKRRKGAELFASPEAEGDKLAREFRFRMIYGDFFFLVFLACLVFALAGPRWGVRIIADYRRGVDVILALDISRSMQVPDAGGDSRLESSASRLESSASRLEAGLRIARDLASSLGDIRMGAAVGRGRGVPAVPLTYDVEAVLNFLDSLDGFSLTGTGTNLESLVDAAAGAFREDSPGRRGIILFSDGEALSGSLETALNRARNKGITVSAVGLGSDEGGPVPVEKSPGAPDGRLLSENGEPVISRRRSELLKSAAEKSGGLYIDGGRGDAALIAADYIRSLSAESGLRGHRRESSPRWRLFVVAALVSLGLSRFLSFGRRKKKKVLQAVCAVFFLGTSCSKIEGKLYVMEGNFFNSRGMFTEAIGSYLKALDYPEAAPYGEYGLGSVYFALEEGKAALERYKAAEEELRGNSHNELLYRIRYNTGIIHFEEGDFTGAAEAFRNALEIDSGRIEAKRNLELSLLTLSRNSSSQASSLGPGREGGETETSALFEYLRKKEQQQWKSRESETAPAGMDY